MTIGDIKEASVVLMRCTKCEYVREVVGSLAGQAQMLDNPAWGRISVGQLAAQDVLSHDCDAHRAALRRAFASRLKVRAYMVANGISFGEWNTTKRTETPIGEAA
jgi:hypothetical protein